MAQIFTHMPLFFVLKSHSFRILAIILFSTTVSLAQQSKDAQNMKIETTREAQYPGGEEKLYTDVYYNLKYSDEAKKNNVESMVMVSLFVGADSTVSNLKILNDPGYGCGESLKAFLQSKKFVPALMNGTPFRTQIMLNVPIRAH